MKAEQKARKQEQKGNKATEKAWSGEKEGNNLVEAWKTTLIAYKALSWLSNNTPHGARVHDHKVKGLALYRLS